MRSALIPRTFRSSKFTVIAVNYVRSKILVFTSWIWLTQVITLLQLVQFLLSVSQEDVLNVCRFTDSQDSNGALVRHD